MQYICCYVLVLSLFYNIKKLNMEDKEKILRWNLQEAIKELNSDVGECPLASMAFAVMENRRKNVEKCQKELSDYINNSKQT